MSNKNNATKLVINATTWSISSKSKSKQQSTTNRIGATNGSVILTNINDSQYDNTGFEFICPTNKSHVIGLRCSNNYNIIPIGTREIKINKWYHVAITVQRVITHGEEADQTDIAVYVLNGKNDGTYNFKKCKDYFDSKNNKTFWTVGHNTKKMNKVHVLMVV